MMQVTAQLLRPLLIPSFIVGQRWSRSADGVDCELEAESLATTH